MNKHMLLTAIVTFFMLFTFAFTAWAADDVKLVINGNEVYCDVPPVIVGGRTLVPARVLFEHFGADVQWDAVFNRVVVKSENNVIIFTIGSNVINLNDNPQFIDVAPIIVDNRTLIPIRFVSQVFGYSIKWDDSSRTVFVDTPSGTFENQTNNPAPEISATEPQTPSTLATITSVYADEDAYSYMLNVGISSRVDPQIMILSNPYRIVFDFYGVNLQGRGGSLKPSNGTVSEVRWASHDGYTRVVVQCNYECNYSWWYSSDTNCYITLPITKQTQAPVQNYAPVGDTPLVVIDAGHGGGDPGALGRDDDGNIVLAEKDVCLNLAHKVQSLLQAQGVSVIMTRSTDTSLGDTQQADLSKRAEIANSSSACLFVSIHNNAFTNTSASGTCVLYAGLESVGDYGISGKELAQFIQDELIAALGLRNRGIVESPGIAVLRKTVMPAALVECAFITNPSDRQVLATRQDDIAAAIARGIIKSLVKMGRLK